MSERYESLARTYFDVWNTRDGAAVGKLFAPDGSLRDWDVAVSGAAAVGDANGGIFKAVPGIEITVEQIVVDAPRAVAVCEILVHLHDEAATVLKVRARVLVGEEGAAARGAAGRRMATVPESAGVLTHAYARTRAATTVQVADVIQFDAETGLIKALRAYKG
jgi:hypothetical protein